MTEPRVLHLDSEHYWRGGQQQAIYLHEGLLRRNIYSEFACKNNSEISKYLSSKNLRSYEFNFSNEFDIVTAYNIALFCSENGVNIIHCHSAHAHSIGLISKYIFNKPLLVSSRRVDFHIQNNKLSRFKYNTDKLSKIICISEAIKKVLIDDGLNDSSLITIHSGIDLNKFDNSSMEIPFEEHNINSDDIVIGTIAAIADHKDYPNLVLAAKKVVEIMPNTKFVALGDGPDREKIEKLISDNQLESKFILAGFKSNVGDYLKMFDIFVLASKTEGLGTSILDAMSVGLPIVASDTGGIPEAVINDYNGYLTQPGDSGLLAKAIIKLINDKNIMDKFGKNSLLKVKEFDINTTIEKNIKLYHEILVQN